MKRQLKFLESSEGDQSEPEEYSPYKIKAKGSKPGPKPIEPRWTRVVKYNPGSDDTIQTFLYAKDSNKFFVESDSDLEDSQSEQAILITHDHLAHEGPELNEESFRLTEIELTKYAKISS